MRGFVSRRALLRAAVPAVVATAGCLDSFEDDSGCNGVSIVRTELDGGNPIGNRSDTIHVTVVVDGADEYTLVGQIETANGRKWIERMLTPERRKQTLEFGPYEGVSAFEFHIEDCMPG